jgi:hypothetical protein
MKRLLLVSLVVSAIAILMPPTSSAQEKARPEGTKQRVTLNIEGVECARCAKVMSDTFAGTDAKIVSAIEPNTKGPSQVVVECASACDLGALAAKVNEAQTPHREKQPPTLSLVLFGELSRQQTQAARAACQKIEGIDAESFRYDTDTNQLQLTVTGKEEVTPKQVVETLANSGVEVELTAPDASRQAPQEDAPK